MQLPLQSPLQPVMRSPLEFRRRGGFNIASTNPSAYYDRTNLATLFQNSAGTTPVTAVTQPIGRVLDQSGGGNNQIQATAGKLPILSSRVNLLTYSTLQGAVAGSPGTAPTGWTITGTSSTMLSVTPDGAGNNVIVLSASANRVFYTQALSVPANTTILYYITCTQNTGNIPVSQIMGMFGLPAGATTSSVANGADVLVTYVPTAGDVIGYRLTTSTTAGTPTMRWGVGVNSNSTSDVGFTKLQVNYGPAAKPYQWITTATDYDTVGFPTYADFDAVDDDLVATFPASLGAGCTVCRSLPGTGASITTGVTLTATFTDNVDAHFLAIYTAAQWAALDAGQIANITALLNAKAGL